MKYYSFLKVRLLPNSFKPKPGNYNALLEFAKFKKAHEENLKNDITELPSPVPILDFTSMSAVLDIQGDDKTGTTKGFFLTDKALNLLQKFNLPEHSIFPVAWSMFGKKHQCYYFYIHGAINKSISIENCLFKIQDTLPPYINYARDIQFKSLEDYKSYKIPDNNTFKQMTLQELCVHDSSQFEKDIFILNHVYLGKGLFFSERLIALLTESSITGFVVLPKSIETYKALGIPN